MTTQRMNIPTDICTLHTTLRKVRSSFNVRFGTAWAFEKDLAYAIVRSNGIAVRRDDVELLFHRSKSFIVARIAEYITVVALYTEGEEIAADLLYHGEAAPIIAIGKVRPMGDGTLLNVELDDLNRVTGG